MKAILLVVKCTCFSIPSPELLAVGQSSPACDGAPATHSPGQSHQVHTLSISTQEVNLLAGPPVYMPRKQARAQMWRGQGGIQLTELGKPVLV